MNANNPLIIVLAIIGGLVVLGLLLNIAFKLIGLLVLVAVGVVIYFFVQNMTGNRR